MDKEFIKNIFSVSHRTTYENFKQIMKDMCLIPVDHISETIHFDKNNTTRSVVFLSYQLKQTFKSIEDVIKSDYKETLDEVKSVNDKRYFSGAPHIDDVLIILNPSILQKYKYFYAFFLENGGMYAGDGVTYTSEKILEIILGKKKYNGKNEFVKKFAEEFKFDNKNDRKKYVNQKKKLKINLKINAEERGPANYRNELCILDKVCFEKYVKCILVDKATYIKNPAFFKKIAQNWDVYIDEKFNDGTVKYKKV